VKQLEEAVKAADPAATSELLRALLDRMEVSFSLSRQGKRTRAAMAEARIFLNGEGVGAVTNFNLVACVGTQAVTNAHRLSAMLKETGAVRVVEPAPPRQASLFGDDS
jgi:hypothetical protein